MNGLKKVCVILFFFLLLCVNNTVAKQMSDADFVGSYIVSHIMFDMHDGFVADVMQFDADGRGDIDLSFLYSSLEENDEPGRVNYAVDKDGRVSIIEGTETSVSGVLASDGRYFTMSSANAGDEPVFMLGIRESAGMSEADLNGSYDIYVYTSADIFETRTFIMTFDGEGDLTFEQDTGEYAVTDKGHLTLLNHHGIVSNDGNVFCVVDTDNSEGILEFMVGIKQSSELTTPDFANEYYHTEFASDTAGNETVDFIKSIVVKTGEFTFEEHNNTSGEPLQSGNGTIVTEAAGRYTLNFGERGTLALDGSLYAQVRENARAGDYINIGIGIPKSSGREPHVNVIGIELSPARSPQVNTPVTVTADAVSTDGQPLYYKYYYCANYGTDAYATTNWTVVQDYSTASSAQYSFPEAGDYIIVVWAVTDPDDEPAILPMAGLSVSVNDSSNVFIGGLSHGAASGITAGESVIFTAEASTHASEPIYYEFYYCANYGTSDYENTPWTRVRAYSTGNTCPITFPTPGDYIVVVWAVKDPADAPSALPIVGCVAHVD